MKYFEVKKYSITNILSIFHKKFVCVRYVYYIDDRSGGRGGGGREGIRERMTKLMQQNVNKC